MRWSRIGSLGLIASFVLSGCGAAFEGNAGDGGKDSASDGTVPAVDAGDDGSVVVDSGGGDDAGDDATVDSGKGDATVGDGGGGSDADGGSTSDSGGGEGGVIESGAGDGGLDGGPTDSGILETGTIDSGGVDAGPLCPTGEVCVAAAPPTWSGPIQFYYASSPGPTCPTSTSLAFTGGTGLVAPPATCTPCGCAGAVSCADAVVDFFSDNTCATQCNTTTASTTCGTMLGGCGTAQQAWVTVQSQVTAAGCTPSAQTPTTTQSWTTNAEGCGPTGTGAVCGAGQICTPATSPSFKLCVYQSGDLACPGGTYSNKQLVDTSVTDSRTCTSCACGASSGAHCGGSGVIIGTTGNCNQGSVVAVPSSCRSLGGFSIPPSVTILEETAPKPGDAGCAPSGGQATGSAAAAGPVTVCCGP